MRADADPREGYLVSVATCTELSSDSTAFWFVVESAASESHLRSTKKLGIATSTANTSLGPFVFLCLELSLYYV